MARQDGVVDEAAGRGAVWRLAVDTGGTFTDCLAVDPAGRAHRAKVLSTAALRGRVTERLGPAVVRLAGGWRVPAGFFRGFAFHLLERDHPAVAVAASGPGGTVLTLQDPLAPDFSPAGAAVELRSPEEAPVLAARLVTAVPPGDRLPPLSMRLATTRGTNALLERKGAPTALFVTRGFADLLRIGTQQRPDLFALAIEKPEPLYRAVVEVAERLAADGSVLAPLDLEALRETALGLLAGGIETAAVALLHGYRNPRHEEALGDFLRRLGFRHVSLSSRLAPLIKLLPRAETAVVDAYLSPVLEGYLAAVAAALPEGSLHVMTSAGGLVRAGAFRAKDSLLSGPAGGVVGATLAGRRSGYRRVISFDMGGTSTDVARSDGDYEYVFEHRVGAAHLLAPALAVESVAAGGGSLCTFDGRQLRVGPESAGARPGPACYGAGGPLTITDVNLILGRIAPERFEIPLEAAAAGRALAGLLAGMAAGGRPAPGGEEVLGGLLDIANERMAEAIRGISLRRGYDPGDYVLVAFGGAGAQHACAVAALLAISTVLVPADASLLSAHGLSAAVVERFASRQVLEPLGAARERLRGWLDELGSEAVEAVAAEGIPADEIRIRRRLLHLRFAGQEATLAVELPAEDEAAGEAGKAGEAGEAGAYDAIERAFGAVYRDTYGYAPEGRSIELESIRVVASSEPAKAGPWPAGEPAAAPDLSTAAPAGRRRAFFGGAWLDVPCFNRESLVPGATLRGPALVLETYTVTVVEEGWQGRMDEAGNIVLQHDPGGGRP